MLRSVPARKRIGDKKGMRFCSALDDLSTISFHALQNDLVHILNGIRERQLAHFHPVGLVRG